MFFSFFFFFFQAEDGIRDADVTGVQTCALPIWPVFYRLRHVRGTRIKQKRRNRDGIYPCSPTRFICLQWRNHWIKRRNWESILSRSIPDKRWGKDLEILFSAMI